MPHPDDPLAELGRWIEEARDAGLASSASVAFITASRSGRPSARTVSLKRLEPDALVFTTALWTRKARELEENPQVALLFHWPSLGRQVHVVGAVAPAERELAEQLWAERDLAHQLQTVVSRQGQPVPDLEEMRLRHRHLTQASEGPPACPADWGAVRVFPRSVVLWREAHDRLHDRLLFERSGDGAWTRTRLSP
jgi:pyridoxamine 5'-phosphate oxidase